VSDLEALNLAFWGVGLGFVSFSLCWMTMVHVRIVRAGQRLDDFEKRWCGELSDWDYREMAIQYIAAGLWRRRCLLFIDGNTVVLRSKRFRRVLTRGDKPVKTGLGALVARVKFRGRDSKSSARVRVTADPRLPEVLQECGWSIDLRARAF